MTPNPPKSSSAPALQAEGITPLLSSLRQLIAESRQQVLRAVDVVQVQTYWHIGQHIVEFEQGGSQRAAYDREFDPTNLRLLRGFYLAFPIRDAVRHELSWQHAPYFEPQFFTPCLENYSLVAKSQSYAGAA